MSTSLRMLMLAALGLLPVREPLAQMYGTSPFQNGASQTPMAGLQKFDPDTGASGCFDPGGGMVCPEARQVVLPGFTVTGVNSLKVDPTDGTDPAIPVAPGDPDDEGSFAYAILKVSGVSGRVLALVDLATGEARQLGNLGDNFSSLAFDAAGNLYGVTGNGAAVPETLYALDKTNAAKVLISALGAGADGEVIEFNASDGRFYHWSGNGTVVFERFEVVLAPPAAPTIANLTTLPVTGTTHGEIFGAAWDACLGDFIASNISSRFERWGLTGSPPSGGTVSDQYGDAPDDMRGLALVGAGGCDVDLVPLLTVDDFTPAPAGVVEITAHVLNAGPARSLDTRVRFTLPPSLSYSGGIPDASGCVESPAGVVTCTLANAAGISLYRNDTVSRTITAVSDGGLGTIQAEALTGSDESVPGDNLTSLSLGLALFRDGFEQP